MKLSRASTCIALALLYMVASETAIAANPPQTNAEMEFELSASLAASHGVNDIDSPADYAFKSGWQDRRLVPFFIHNQFCDPFISGRVFNPAIQGRSFVIIRPVR